jgi:proline iminopeptidase
MRPIRAVFLAVIAGVVAAAVAYAALIRPKIKSWGFDELEAEKQFAGDELVADPTAVETRGITIDDTPDKVWPWLVQMGYGRAGWYSYEPLDSKIPSAKEILPEFQELRAGDMKPT